MKRALIVLLLGCVAATYGTAALAGETNAGAGIALHVTPWESPGEPLCGLTILPEDLNTEADLVGEPLDLDWFIVYVLVCNASDSLGVAGVEYGIDYDGDLSAGVDVISWRACSDLQFPTGLPNVVWPGAGSGNLQTWDYTINCQNTLSNPYLPMSVIAVAGFLEVQVWGPDQIFVTPRPVATPAAKVGDCFGVEWDLTDAPVSHLGVAAFGGMPLEGYNPCVAPTPVQSSTWGKIKQQY